MPKITQEQFKSLYSDDITKKEYDRIIGLIDDRFAEICDKFVIRKPSKASWYDYGNVEYDVEDSRGYFDPQSYNETIEIGGEWIDPPQGYDHSIPTRWLWEDFETELAETIAAAVKAAEEAKNKKKEQKIEKDKRKQKLQESILLKLTEEELKIISFK